MHDEGAIRDDLERCAGVEVTPAAALEPLGVELGVDGVRTPDRRMRLPQLAVNCT